MATLWADGHCLYICCLALVLVLAFGILVLLICKILNKLQYYHNRESTADIPPGSRGLPLIGETLQFMAAINSSKGFYEFVRIRRLW